jgi:acyl-coenzyme A thioesterase PaaI-like protein
MNLAALCLLADVGMGVSMRQQLGAATRMATVSMALRFTGAQRRGRLSLQGWLEGFVAGAAARQGLARAEIRSGDELVCSASSVFVGLGNPEGLSPLPMRRRGQGAGVAPLSVAADHRN